MDVEEIGRRVKERRVGRGWSLRQLAERAGVSHAWIDNVERARAQKVDVAMLAQVAQALGVPLGELMGEDVIGVEYDGADLLRVVRRLPVEDRLLVEDFARLLEIRAEAELRMKLPTRVLGEGGMQLHGEQRLDRLDRGERERSRERA